MDEQARITKLEHDVQVIREQGATKVDLAELKAEVLAKIAVVKADVLVRLAEVECAVRTEIVRSFSSVRVDIERANGRLFRWVVLVLLLGQLVPALLKYSGI